MQINEALLGKGREDLTLSNEDVALMKSLIESLEPFNGAIKKFEGEKMPTIHHVYPQYLKLKSATATRRGDASVMAKFKERLRFHLEDKMKKNISMRHKLGAFFYPKFASLNIFSPEEKVEVRTLYDYFRRTSTIVGYTIAVSCRYLQLFAL